MIKTIKKNVVEPHEFKIEKPKTIPQNDTKIIGINLNLKEKPISKIWCNFINNRPRAFNKVLQKAGISIDQMKVRKCENCGKKLSFKDFFLVNASLGLGKAIEIWQNLALEFHCCQS